MSRCRDCDARIFWAVNDRGKNVPVDYDSELAPEFDHARMYKTRVDFDPARMSLHFDTCPFVADKRKGIYREPIQETSWYESRGTDE